MKKINFLTAVMLAVLVCSPAVQATTITVLIGDDDGFGGTQGVTSSPGDPYSNASAASLGTIAPGTYANEAALDVNTVSPWSPYTFTFDYNYDVTSLAAISSAFVEIQHGSLSRRTTGIISGSGPGFGFATVTASTGGPSTALGDFLTVDTSPTHSPLEESVKVSKFDVASLISAGTVGTLTLTIDGTGISPNPVDLFAMDFARLTVTGSMSVPEPTTLAILGLGLAGLGFTRCRRAT